MPRIFFQRNKCIGCNACVEAAPNRWRVSRSDGRCFLIGGVEKRGIYQTTITYEELDDNLRAAVNCPAKIIKVEE